MIRNILPSTLLILIYLCLPPLSPPPELEEEPCTSIFTGHPDLLFISAIKEQANSH